MYRLIQFFKRYSVLLLFVALEVLAVNHYANSTNYTRAKALSASNRVVGGVHGFFTSIGDWFTLRRDNRELLEQLAQAQTELAAYRETSYDYARRLADIGRADSIRRDSVVVHPEAEYFYSSARVVSNTVSRRSNYFVINRGEKDGVRKNMAVTSPQGVVAGYVEAVSPNYAVCVSVLNEDFRIGGRIIDKDYTGSVSWDGVSTDHVILSDIPKYAPLQPGDRVVSAHSSRFPSGLTIGTVESLGDSPDGTTYRVRVKMPLRMARLSEVLLIDYRNSGELHTLEQVYMEAPDNQNR